MKFASSQVKCRSFTLIELLVVTAIISLLASLVLSAVRSARESAKTVQCASQLRQIGIAIQLYGNEEGFFVPSITATTKWSLILAPYLDRPNANTYGAESSNWVSTVFVCPAREKKTDVTYPTYAVHRELCHVIPGDYPTPRAFGDITRPSEIVLCADVMQASVFNYGAFAALDFGFVTTNGNPLSAQQAIAPGADSDDVNGANLRYRHRRGVNLLYVDGHVRHVARGDVREQDVMVNY